MNALSTNSLICIAPQVGIKSLGLFVNLILLNVILILTS